MMMEAEVYPSTSASMLIRTLSSLSIWSYKISQAAPIFPISFKSSQGRKSSLFAASHFFCSWSDVIPRLYRIVCSGVMKQSGLTFSYNLYSILLHLHIQRIRPSAAVRRKTDSIQLPYSQKERCLFSLPQNLSSLGS